VRVDVLLKTPLLFQQLVHRVVIHRLRELHRDGVESLERVALGLERGLDVAADIPGFVQLRLLREVADLRALRRPRFALNVGVDAGHDAEQRGLPGAVRSEDADLRAGIEREPDVVEDHARRWHHLAQGLHDVDELRRHSRLRIED
jgi:hypothetical protein